jgi:hypothetical protein
LAIGKVPVTPVVKGRPVAFVKVAEVGVPRIGVTRVGDVANTFAPLPVSSVKAAAKLALDGVPKKVAIPVAKEVIPVPPFATGSVPVTFVAALTNVVEVDPVPPLAIGKVPVTPVDNGRPVALVRVALVGVPRIGVTSVGEVDNTLLPDPVLVPTPVPPFVTFSNGPASNNASIESRSVLIFVPHVSVEAPTSGFVKPRFVVVVSAIIYP